MNNQLEKIKQKLKKIKVEYLIVALIIISVLIIFFSNFATNSDSSAKDSLAVEEYVTMLENKLSKHLSEINGAGKVSVIISVKEGVFTEIATEKNTVSNVSGEKTEETPILVSGKPIVLNEIYPEICGVVIIAKGASDIKVKHALLSATQVFLDLTADKIEILTMR